MIWFGFSTVFHRLHCINTLWVKSVKVSDKTVQRKIENGLGTWSSCFTLFSA